jgi:death-on-curing protein
MSTFLLFDEVLALHTRQIDQYGGAYGLRDLGLLQSALATPEASFDGEPLHPTVFEQAAAYLYHLVKNHPFVDGNERIGLACALVFLRLNGHRLRALEDDVAALVERVAEGTASKAEVAVFLSRNDHP